MSVEVSDIATTSPRKFYWHALHRGYLVYVRCHNVKYKFYFKLTCLMWQYEVRSAKLQCWRTLHCNNEDMVTIINHVQNCAFARERCLAHFGHICTWGFFFYSCLEIARKRSNLAAELPWAISSDFNKWNVWPLSMVSFYFRQKNWK